MAIQHLVCTLLPMLVDLGGLPLSRDELEAVVHAGIDQGEMPGAVVLIVFRGEVVFHEAYGLAQVEPAERDMTVDAIFDLASLTKPIATATSIMLLADEGLVDVETAAVKYLPEFTGHGKEAITIRELLVHQGGLIADNHLRDYADGPLAAWERICALPLRSPPGEQFIYSDVGFIVLGKIVERVSSQPLDDFASERTFAPLGMRDTGFCISHHLSAEERVRRCVPTQQRGTEWLLGEVHDPRAAALEGVAGHAGLFSTADDLSRYARMILAGGTWADRQFLSPESVAVMSASYPVSRGIRGLGWDKQSPYSSNRGDGMTDRAIGHGGFTGTSLWIDPGLDLAVIFLSSRLHPDGQGTVNPLIGQIGTLAASAAKEVLRPDE